MITINSEYEDIVREALVEYKAICEQNVKMYKPYANKFKYWSAELSEVTGALLHIDRQISMKGK